MCVCVCVRACVRACVKVCWLSLLGCERGAGLCWEDEGVLRRVCASGGGEAGGAPRSRPRLVVGGPHQEDARPGRGRPRHQHGHVRAGYRGQQGRRRTELQGRSRFIVYCTQSFHVEGLFKAGKQSETAAIM